MVNVMETYLCRELLSEIILILTFKCFLILNDLVCSSHGGGEGEKLSQCIQAGPKLVIVGVLVVVDE